MIYVIQMEGTDFYKIGYCRANLPKRVQSLQSGAPLPLIYVALFEGERELETKVHRHLSNFWAGGGKEWFSLKNGFSDIPSMLTNQDSLNLDVALEYGKDMLRRYQEKHRSVNAEKLKGYRAKYRSENRDFLRCRRKVNREENKVVIASKRKEYKDKNREHINKLKRENARKNYDKNRIKNSERAKVYYENNKVKICEKYRERYKMRSNNREPKAAASQASLF